MLNHFNIVPAAPMIAGRVVKLIARVLFRLQRYETRNTFRRERHTAIVDQTCAAVLEAPLHQRLLFASYMTSSIQHMWRIAHLAQCAYIDLNVGSGGEGTITCSVEGQRAHDEQRAPGDEPGEALRDEQEYHVALPLLSQSRELGGQAIQFAPRFRWETAQPIDDKGSAATAEHRIEQ